MKQALIIFFMITNIVSAQALRQDKLLHASGSYFVSSTVSSLVYDKTGDRNKSLAIGFAVSMLVGIGKEVYDIKHGDPDVKDILANTVGSSLGIITIRITL
tara:strand:+ start:69 stop:371 length:303 start_codon:yes stop_codon:yes gene_type:complete